MKTQSILYATLALICATAAPTTKSFAQSNYEMSTTSNDAHDDVVAKLPSNNNTVCQVSFSINDSNLAEASKQRLAEIGWESLMFVKNVAGDSIALYPITFEGLTSNFRHIRRTNQMGQILQGAFRFICPPKEAFAAGRRKANDLMHWYAEAIMKKIIDEPTFSIEHFPGDDTMWQVQFSFILEP